MILDKDPAAVNDEDNDSQTALHLACVHGKYDVVELLLDKGGTNSHVTSKDEEKLQSIVHNLTTMAPTR